MARTLHALGTIGLVFQLVACSPNDGGPSNDQGPYRPLTSEQTGQMNFLLEGLSDTQVAVAPFQSNQADRLARKAGLKAISEKVQNDCNPTLIWDTDNKQILSATASGSNCPIKFDFKVTEKGVDGIPAESQTSWSYEALQPTAKSALDVQKVGVNAYRRFIAQKAETGERTGSVETGAWGKFESASYSAATISYNSRSTFVQTAGHTTEFAMTQILIENGDLKVRLRKFEKFVDGKLQPTKDYTAYELNQVKIEPETYATYEALVPNLGFPLKPELGGFVKQALK